MEVPKTFEDPICLEEARLLEVAKCLYPACNKQRVMRVIGHYNSAQVGRHIFGVLWRVSWLRILHFPEPFIFFLTPLLRVGG